MGFHEELQMLLNKHKVNGALLVTFGKKENGKMALPVVMRAISTDSQVNTASMFFEAQLEGAAQVGVEAGIFEV